MSLFTSVLKDLIGPDKSASQPTDAASPSPSSSRASSAQAAAVPSNRSQREVVLLSGLGQNDAIAGLLREYELLLQGHGIAVHYFNLSDPNVDRSAIVSLLSSGRVAFALTYLGIGSELSVTVQGADQTQHNIWEFFHTPLLKLNGDIPAYFAARHDPVPKTSVNVYYAREFHHYAENWIGDRQHGMINVLRSPYPISCTSPSPADRSKRRHGKLIFLKNGNSPTALVEQWRSNLSPTICKQLMELCEALREDLFGSAVVFMDDRVRAFLIARGYSGNVPPALMHFYVSQLDDYFRRVKSTMIAEALLDHPVIVQGNNWEHVDFANRKARHVPGASFSDSADIYRTQLGVVDMSPNINSAPHDRVTRSAGNYSLCITNRQQWLLDHFPGFENLAFAFTPESIAARIDDALRRPDDYLDLAHAFGARFREVWSADRVFDQLIEAADMASLLHTQPRPNLQPFFVW